jgi:hypothetical protein
MPGDEQDRGAAERPAAGSGTVAVELEDGIA